jgi:ferrous iron transport protein A
MSQALHFTLEAPRAQSPTTAREPAGPLSDLALSNLRAGDSAYVVELALEREMADWLRAVGISERERVTVLRRAAFGGPIHVRTSSGGEFALHAALAASVVTRRTPPEGEVPR